MGSDVGKAIPQVDLLIKVLEYKLNMVVWDT